MLRSTLAANMAAFKCERALMPKKTMGKAAFEQVASLSPKRICFGTTHSRSLREGASDGKFSHFFSLPFRDSAGPLFSYDTGYRLYDGRSGGCWFGVSSAFERTRILAWMNDHSENIFLRDTMDLSCALGMNIHDGEHTRIGALEHAAKFDQSDGAANELVNELQQFIAQNPLYDFANAICAVPPRPGKPFDLPTVLAGRLAAATGKELINSAKWQGQKPSLKEIPAQAKWDALDNARLNFGIDVKGKRVLLIDDLYQSGCTTNFVAEKLVAAGASRVFGLAIVKSMRDTDNI